MDTLDVTDRVTDGAFTFTMPDGDVIVNAVFAPFFGEPDFTLPSALTAIEESAFEGITGMTVVDASHCASIGKDAFKGCVNLTQIRLPKNCAIDPDAFGSQTIYVFAPAGGDTQAYCENHGNLIFVEDDWQNMESFTDDSGHVYGF